MRATDAYLRAPARPRAAVERWGGGPSTVSGAVGNRRRSSVSYTGVSYPSTHPRGVCRGLKLHHPVLFLHPTSRLLSFPENWFRLGPGNVPTAVQQMGSNAQSLPECFSFPLIQLLPSGTQGSARKGPI